MAKVPFLAPGTKPGARLTSLTTFLAQARKGTLAIVVMQELEIHKNTRCKLGINRAI